MGLYLLNFPSEFVRTSRSKVIFSIIFELEASVVASEAACFISTADFSGPGGRLHSANAARVPRRNERKIYDPQAKADRTDLNLAPFVSAGRICRAGMPGVSRLVYLDWQIVPFLAFLSSVFSPPELLYELPARRALLSVLPWNLRRINYARFAPTRNNARRIDRPGNYQAIVHT